MNAPEEKDPAWELLKKSQPVKASPFFSRNVVREVRKQEAEQADQAFSWEALFTWFRKPSNAVLVAGLVMGLIAVAVLRSGVSTPSSEGEAPILAETKTPLPAGKTETIDPGNAAEYDPAEEIESIEYLGQLMAVADPATLNDDVLADLFF